MYFTTLPNHKEAGFDEAAHFANFKKHNIIFNALANGSCCDNHVGCLSFKTVLSGEEWYGINNRQLALRPGQFLILNNDQNYSCRSDNGEKLRILSIFFKKDFAMSVFRDTLHNEDVLLDTPFETENLPLEFFQTLTDIDRDLHFKVSDIITSLETGGYDSFVMSESLIFLLEYLIQLHKTESKGIDKVRAIKSNTKEEIHKRLRIAKDVIHSFYMDALDLNSISSFASLSVPQLVRQFKSVFHLTPHQYLMQVRIKQASGLLKETKKPVHEIAWMCGFENVSAFCRAFKFDKGTNPVRFRKVEPI